MFSDKCYLVSHAQTHRLSQEAGTLLSFRPSDKPAALQNGKSALAAVRVYRLWSISRAVLPLSSRGCRDGLLWEAEGRLDWCPRGGVAELIL